jgi:hypothetical protein
MKFNQLIVVLLSCVFAVASFTGCQTTVGSGGIRCGHQHWLKDDIQYYPAGPEFLKKNQVQTLEHYKASHQAENKPSSTDSQ